MANIVLLDNTDSFIYNLVDQLRLNNHKVIIYRNCLPINIILKSIANIKEPILILSAGPGMPSYSGCMLKLLQKLIKKIPIVGICLGHQAIIEAYGGYIEQTKDILHGKTSLIYHDNIAMFANMPNPLLVARYHSLVGRKIPDNLIINAYFNDITMAVRNDTDRIYGFQFHPESILTTLGSNLLDKTINWAIQSN